MSIYQEIINYIKGGMIMNRPELKNCTQSELDKMADEELKSIIGSVDTEKNNIISFRRTKS